MPKWAREEEGWSRRGLFFFIPFLKSSYRTWSFIFAFGYTDHLGRFFKRLSASLHISSGNFRVLKSLYRIQIPFVGVFSFLYFPEGSFTIKEKTKGGRKRETKVAKENSWNFEFKRKATKSFTSATAVLAGWFELHQLKKAVPQKFHNATVGGLRQMSLHIRPLSISTG